MPAAKAKTKEQAEKSVPKGRAFQHSNADVTSWLPKVCSLAQFSGLSGASVPHLTSLKAKGILRLDENGRVMPLASLHSYLSYLRDRAMGRAEEGTTSLATERARLTRLQSEEQEIRNKKLRGDLLEATEVAEAWSRVMRSVRGSVMSIPSKMRSRFPHLTADETEMIRDLCREILEDAAVEIESIAEFTAGAGNVQ